MATTTPDTGSELETLSTQECWRRLEDHLIGRLAYSDHDGPAIVPVNYVVHEGAVWVRTGSWTQAAVQAPGKAVAFEIDGLDEAHQRGWSVLVRGLAEHVLVHDPRVAALPERSLPWAAGPRRMILRIAPTEVTGHRLGGRA